MGGGACLRLLRLSPALTTWHEKKYLFWQRQRNGFGDSIPGPSLLQRLRCRLLKNESSSPPVNYPTTRGLSKTVTFLTGKREQPVRPGGGQVHGFERKRPLLHRVATRNLPTRAELETPFLGTGRYRLVIGRMGVN